MRAEEPIASRRTVSAELKFRNCLRWKNGQSWACELKTLVHKARTVSDDYSDLERDIPVKEKEDSVEGKTRGMINIYPKAW